MNWWIWSVLNKKVYKLGERKISPCKAPERWVNAFMTKHPKSYKTYHGAKEKESGDNCLDQWKSVVGELGTKSKRYSAYDRKKKRKRKKRVCATNDNNS